MMQTTKLFFVAFVALVVVGTFLMFFETHQLDNGSTKSLRESVSSSVNPNSDVNVVVNSDTPTSRDNHAPKYELAEDDENVVIAENAATEAAAAVKAAGDKAVITNVHVCGYDFQLLARTLFPEGRVAKWDGHVGSVNDVLMVSGWCPREILKFPGRVLYVDGEGGTLPMADHSRTYYLGVVPPPRPVEGNVQVFHVAHTTLFHPFSANDFLKPRTTNPSPRFLVYMNSHCVKFREQAFDALVDLATKHQMEEPVAMGKCHGSHNELQQHETDQNNRITNVVSKMRPFRFALVMENSNRKTYVTEKIANAFMAATIPIYYGTTDVFELFNKDAFIYYNVKDPQPALDRIAYLETNRMAYAEVLAKPILADGERTLEEYFSLSDDVGGGRLKQQIRDMLLGKKHGTQDDQRARASVAHLIDNQSHTPTNRPPDTDPRDQVLLQYSARACRGGGGQLVMGQDVRVQQDPVLYSMRNPKYLCDVAGLGAVRPCVVYSFGSWDEISFEVGMDALAPQCEVHVFDPSKYPGPASQARYNFTSHHYGIGVEDTPTMRTLRTIMDELGHDHVDVFKIDIENGETDILPWLTSNGMFPRIDQIPIEFHSVEGMRVGMELLTKHGFEMTYARREDRCPSCTEVALETTRPLLDDQ